MKIIALKIAAFFLLSIAINVNGQTVKGKFDLVRNDSTSLIIKIQLAVLSDSIALGNSTLRFSYNDSCLSAADSSDFFTLKQIKEKYFASLTIPSDGIISLNIAHKDDESIYIHERFSDLVTISFNKTFPCRKYKFKWVMLEIFEPKSSKPLFTKYFEDLIINN